MRHGQLAFPQDVAADTSGHLYVAVNDFASDDEAVIEVYDSTNGAFVRSWPVIDVFGDPLYPHSIAVVGSSVYVTAAWYGGEQAIIYNATNGQLIDRWGTYGFGDGQFSGPEGIAIDTEGNVYVADSDNDRVQKFDSSGRYLTEWGTPGSASGQFQAPSGVAVGPNNEIYVVDRGNNRVQQFSTSGDYEAQWGSYGSGHGQFRSAADAAVDSQGRLFVVDYSLANVQRFGPPSPPSAPRSLLATPGNGEVALAWSPPTSSGGLPLVNYRIYRDGEFIGATPTGVRTSYSDGGLLNGEPHTYTVSAVNEAGESPLSGSVTATPTASSLQPDAQVRTSSQTTFKGNDIYNPDGAAQGVGGNLRRGVRANFYVRVQNDGNVRDVFRLQGPSTGSGFTVAYYSSTGATITSSVTAGTFTSASLSPGASQWVRVSVTASSSTRVGASRGLLVTSRSTGQPSQVDAVKIRAAVTS